MTEDVKLSTPRWSISDEETKRFLPDSGFIRDYVEYARSCTDAPLIFHYATAVTILSMASSKADIYCPDPADKKRGYKIPTCIWSALIGSSGASRKSSSMTLGVNLLKRVFAITNNPEVILPSDGSIEAWHDFLVEHNEALLYRDEFSLLFDQARRGYSEGLKNWLMEIYSGHTKRRVTRKDKAAKEDKTIERPRLTILGGIPPDVFKRVATLGDWSSGFLARFAFWPAERERFVRYPAANEAEEGILARWLYKQGTTVTGYIQVPHRCREILMDWFEESIEKQREDLPDGLYSHLVRYQDLALRLASMHAVARRSDKAELVEVWEEDMENAIKVLRGLKKSITELYRHSNKGSERDKEDELLNFLKMQKKPVTAQEIVNRTSLAYGVALRYLRVLTEMQVVKAKKPLTNTVGRPRILYSLNF